MQEFSYIIDTSNLENLPDDWVLEPTESECLKIQKRLGLEALSNLTAHIALKKDPNAKIFHLQMEITASVVQECVVTLEPVEEQIKESFKLILKPAPLAERDFDHIPEIIELPKNGLVDVGELMIQNLSLLLPLFPKKPELRTSLFEENFGDKDVEAAKKNPFDVLKNLDKKKSNKPE